MKIMKIKMMNSKRLTGLSLILFLLSFSPAVAQKQLTILHTNDTHSCILPLKANLADTMLANRGGFLRRIYDAGTIGNHEFDFGLENMTRLFKMAKFPIVCSNYDFADTELADIVKPYVVLKRKGVKIGVFALCPPLQGLISTKNYGPLRFLDPIEATKRMVRVLRQEQKCDLVICLSHMGWEESKEFPDPQIFTATEGVDLVLGGHSHTYMKQLEHLTDQAGHDVSVDQNGKHGVFIGKLVLTMEKK